MANRNLSPQQMFFAMAKAHVPSHRFEAGMDFAAWKAETYPKVIATLGAFPEKVAANPELLAEWEEQGVRKQRWLIDVAPYMSAVVIVSRPLNLAEGEQRPTLLCWHGHGKYGKDSVMGNDSDDARAAEIARFNYNYGLQMAQRGYVTFALDWLGVGERADWAKPHFLTHNGGRDWCNLYYLHATMFGMTSLSINIAHGMAATDFVCTLPFVDADNLGVMGLSGGGTMTTWTALCDPRMKAAEIICYCDTWPIFGMRDLNYCGMQVSPGLFALVDLPDLQGLIAPKPLLMDIGIYDTCFNLDSALPAYKRLEAIYQAAGAEIDIDLFPGEHAWGGNKSAAFFGKHLEMAVKA
jgi:dienelactone hydrolase